MAETFPTDPETLDLLDVALSNPIGSSLDGLLRVLSGYDPFTGAAPADKRPGWSREDIIRSLLAEVRHLRALIPEGAT